MIPGTRPREWRRKKALARGTKRLVSRKRIKRTPFRTKRPERGSRAWLEDTLDREVSRRVRAQEPACVTCGETKPEKLECSHLFGRAHKATRYDTEPEGNNHTQCRACNRRRKKTLADYVAWYKSRFGVPAYEALERRAKAAIKWENDQLWSMIQDLRTPGSKL